MTNKVEELFDSILVNDIEMFNKLINKTDINSLDEDGSSLLHIAIGYKKDKIALDLIEKGIDVNIQDSDGFTALHYVAEHFKIEIAKAILEKNGDVNVYNKYGNNALWTATFNSNKGYEIVKLYLAHGGDAKHNNNNDKSSIDFAKQINDYELINLLENYCCS
jgi:ankyrin repeat protein